MDKEYHILNGDALKEQFPAEIKGEVRVFRECLMEGPVNDLALDKFLNSRANFISNTYGGTETEYLTTIQSEFKKINGLPLGQPIHLWFEDDLFCQVNFWFLVHFLVGHGQSNLFLVRPPFHNQYGFGGLSEEGLITIYKNKTPLKHLDMLKKLWPAYQKAEIKELKKIALELEETYPFLLEAVQAHEERVPKANDPGRPVRSLITIMNELNTKEFGPIFREFCKRESIYGFGDLQVKRMFDQVVE
ncbi:MAG: DUF1835 domain-containing protein [Bacteroidota bacterium]